MYNIGTKLCTHGIIYITIFIAYFVYPKHKLLQLDIFDGQIAFSFRNNKSITIPFETAFLSQETIIGVRHDLRGRVFENHLRDYFFQ